MNDEISRFIDDKCVMILVNNLEGCRLHAASIEAQHLSRQVALREPLAWKYRWLDTSVRFE
jgi:hypothetical protein